MPENYRQLSEGLFAQMADFFDNLATRAPDLDADWLDDQVFKIEFENGNEVLISKHDSSEEIWLSAPSGGFHFHFENGKWLDPRTQQEFSSCLAECLKQAGQLNVDLPF